MDNAFNYAHDHAMMTESFYPYMGLNLKCFDGTGEVTVSTHTDITINDPNALLAAIS